MKLNTKLLLSTIFFIPGFSVSINREIPNWYDQVDKLLADFSTIEQALSSDISLYQGIAKNLDLVITQFDERDAERKKLIKIVQDKILELSNLLAQAKADNINLAQQKDSIIADLQSKLDALKAQTENDIANLKQQIAEITSELDAAQQAYEELVNLDSQKAGEIVTQLTATRDAYQGMLDSRTSFLSSLQKFTDAALAHLATEKQDIEALSAEITK